MDVLDRIERHPAEPLRRVVAELERGPPVGGLVQRDGEQHRYDPDRCGQNPRLDHWGDTRANKASSSRRPSASSNGFGLLPRRLHAVESLPCAAGEARHRRRNFLHFVTLAVAVQGHVAAGCERGGGPCADRAGQRPHGQVVAEEQAVETDRAPHGFLDHGPGERARSLRIQRRVTDMGGQTSRHVAQRPERHKVAGAERLERRLDPRQHRVAVGSRPAVSRHVLDGRHDAACAQAVRDRASQPDHRVRIGAERTIADDRAGFDEAEVQHRNAVDRDPERIQVRRHQSGAQPGRALACGPIDLGQRTEKRRRGRHAPVRRAEPGHPAALLIDQHRRVGPPDSIAQRSDQGPHLFRALAVALEQDEASRIGVRHEAVFACVERRARAAKHHRPRRGVWRHARLNPGARSTRARAPSTAHRPAAPPPGR